MKKRVKLSLIWILVFILTCVNSNIIFAFSGMTAEEYYKNSTIIPEILENNIKKMEKINSYGPEFVINYITITGEKKDVINTLAEVKTLSDTLCVGLTDDYDKIKAFSLYVSENIYYDFDAAHNSVTFDVICLQNVLERKRTTCAGYSNLFSALCNAQGIYCVNIRGAAPGDGITRKTLNSESAPTNHEWVAAYYEKENRWVYVDPTWNSNNAYRNGKFNYYASTTRYFDISLELLSIEHKARIVDYRNFFEALTIYEDKTTTNSKVNTTTTNASTVTTKKFENSSNQPIQSQSVTNESKPNETNHESEIEADETKTLDKTSTENNKNTSKTTKKTDKNSSRLDNIESLNTEANTNEKSNFDDAKPYGLIVTLIIIGISCLSAGGYFVFKKFKK